MLITRHAGDQAQFLRCYDLPLPRLRLQGTLDQAAQEITHDFFAATAFHYLIFGYRGYWTSPLRMA